MTPVPARCELCRHARRLEFTDRIIPSIDDALVCMRIVSSSIEEIDDAHPTPAQILDNDFGDSPMLAVAPTFCCSLFEAKTK